MGKLVNKTELAEILGKSQVTLTSWQSAGMPIKLAGKRGTSNQYDTEDVIKWLVSREIEKLTVTDDGQVFDLDAERSRLTHHQANKTALEEKTLKGELIPAEEVFSKWEKMVSGFRAKMLSMPTKTSHLLVNVQEFDEIESILKSHIYEALKELSNEGTDENIKQDI